MKHFRKIWDERTNGFIIAHKELEFSDQYRLFLETFPDSEVSETAYRNQCSRLGTRPHREPHSTRVRPLYSEQEKKGYVRIKIAMPNVWISKAKWVYQETHPWDITEEDSEYIFVDGNNRNFSPDNIERLPRRLQPEFIRQGGTCSDSPELTRLRIQNARLKFACFDAGEKLGLVRDNGGGRVFVEDFKIKQRERQRKYRADPERYARIKENLRKRRHELKTNNPQKYREILEKHRAYFKARKKQKARSIDD